MLLIKISIFAPDINYYYTLLMKIAGFTIIRNAVKFDFPVIEAINSILPICDEFVVAVGKSNDGTLDLIKSIDSKKIKIIETVWDDSLKGENGKVFALETDKAFKHISKDVDWAFYIQSDEIVHEDKLEYIKSQMIKYKDDHKVDGLLFNYKHFYGSYDYLGGNLHWYRREIRIVRNKSNIYSYKDAQGFRKDSNKKLKVKHIDAEIYHYGWVRDPKAFAEKVNYQNSMHFQKYKKIENEYDFSEIDVLIPFEGTHPKVIQNRINRMNWKFEYNTSLNKHTLKDKFKLFVEKYTNYRVGEYKNYIRI